MEPGNSQQRVVSIHHTLTETVNMESDNPFISRTVAILINDNTTKPLDQISCTYSILGPLFPTHEPTSTKNCNLVLGLQFRILLDYNNEATFHARKSINCELVCLYSIDIKTIALGTNSQHSSAILDNLIPFRFHWRMQDNINNYLLGK